MGKMLAGKIAMVTGAAQGIGRAVSEALGRAGAAVALCDVLPEEPADLANLLPDAAYFACDVSQREAVEQTVKAVAERFGAMHILVNNAGIAVDALLMRTSPEQWQRVLDINLGGAFNCSKAAARYLLKAKGSGRIVNISSVVGEQGNAGQAAYAASKAGLLGLTKSLAREFAPRGVTVNAVSPGFIETPMTAAHVSGEQREALLRAIPLGRMGSATEVANAVCWLCSPQAAYITGQVLRVNGGMYM